MRVKRCVECGAPIMSGEDHYEITIFGVDQPPILVCMERACADKMLAGLRLGLLRVNRGFAIRVER